MSASWHAGGQRLMDAKFCSACHGKLRRHPLHRRKAGSSEGAASMYQSHRLGRRFDKQMPATVSATSWRRAG